MHLMRACLLAFLLMIFRVGSMERELPTWGDWEPAEWVDEWYNKDATVAMLENPSLPADSSTVQATQRHQQASWGDDTYRIRHIPAAVIPPSTHPPPPHPPLSQAPLDPEVFKAHSQTNDGLATNTHALVGDEPIPWDLRAITQPLPKGSNSQDPFEHLFSRWAGSQQPSVGPQFMPDSSHTSPAILPPNVLPFSDNPHPSSSKIAPQPWHQDAFTLDHPHKLPAESSTAQEVHHTFRANVPNYPTGHSAAEPMSPHPPLLHLPAQAGPEIQAAHSQNAGLDTRMSNPTTLFGNNPNPWDLQTISNQLTNGPTIQDSSEDFISMSHSSTPYFMPHSSYTTLATGFSHILHDAPENSQQPHFKTPTPESEQRTHKIIPKLKPSTEPFKKPYKKRIWIQNSSSLSQMTHLMPPPSEVTTSCPLPSENNELTPHHGPLEFDITLFEDVSAQDPDQNAEKGLFLREIDRLPGKLLIIQEDKFQETYLSYLHWEDCIQPPQKSRKMNDQRQIMIRQKLREFCGDMELWYHRWHMITSFDFQKDRPLPAHNSNYKMANIVEVTYALYLFFVEMIGSIVPIKSTTSRDLETELKSAQKSFAILSTHPKKQLQARLWKPPTGTWARYTMPILWAYVGNWMRTERPGVFQMTDDSEDVLPDIKSFFNRAFVFSYSAIARRYNCKKEI